MIIIQSKNERALNKLKLMVDADVYLKLLVMFSGETIYFPAIGTADDREQRNKCIRDDFIRGLTIPELMELYGLSESQIRRIIKDRAV